MTGWRGSWNIRALEYKNSVRYSFSTRHTQCVTAKQNSFSLKVENKKSQTATSNVLDPRMENITKAFRFMCMSVVLNLDTCLPGWCQRSSEEDVGFPELELKRAVSCPVDAYESGSSVRATNTLNPWAISPAPYYTSFKMSNKCLPTKWTTVNGPHVIKGVSKTSVRALVLLWRFIFIIFKHVHVSGGTCTWAQVSLEAKGIRALGSGVANLLMWVLGTELTSSTKQYTLLNHRAISLVPCALAYNDTETRTNIHLASVQGRNKVLQHYHVCTVLVRTPPCL